MRGETLASVAAVVVLALGWAHTGSASCSPASGDIAAGSAGSLVRTVARAVGWVLSFHLTWVS